MTLVLVLVSLLLVWVFGWAIFVNAPGGTRVLNSLLLILLLVGAIAVVVAVLPS